MGFCHSVRNSTNPSLNLGSDSVTLKVTNQVPLKVGMPLLLKCDVTAGDCSHLAKVDGWKWNTANRGM